MNAIFTKNEIERENAVRIGISYGIGKVMDFIRRCQFNTVKNTEDLDVEDFAFEQGKIAASARILAELSNAIRDLRND